MCNYNERYNPLAAPQKAVGLAGKACASRNRNNDNINDNNGFRVAASHDFLKKIGVFHFG